MREVDIDEIPVVDLLRLAAKAGRDGDHYQEHCLQTYFEERVLTHGPPTSDDLDRTVLDDTYPKVAPGYVTLVCKRLARSLRGDVPALERELERKRRGLALLEAAGYGEE
jgi:hypothetical protein